MKLVLLLTALTTGYTATAQLSLLLGVQAGYPLKPQQAYYHSVSAGMSLEANYKFQQSNIFPFIKAGIATLDLPLTTIAGNSLTVSNTAHTYEIGLYRRVYGEEEDQSSFIAGIGIGVDIISPNRTNVMRGGSPSGLSLGLGDNAAIYPDAAVCLQYRSYIRYDGPWFYSARAEVSALYLANQQNNYLLIPLPSDNGAKMPNLVFWPTITVQVGRTFNRR